MDRLRMRGAADVQVDAPDGPRKRFAAFKDREETHAQKGAEDPDDAHRDPASEKRLAEDVTGAVHGHWPQNQEGQCLRKA